MDRSLDEILAERQTRNGPRGSRGPRRPRADRSDRDGSQRRGRLDYPRDGIRKSYRDEPRNLDSEWVHDKFDDNEHRRGRLSRRRGDSPEPEIREETNQGTKIRVENLHYDLGKDDLTWLFTKIGKVSGVDLKFDRSGRSEGVAIVEFVSYSDAVAAVDEYDGANAAGQPIKLTLIPSGSSRGARRNPFDTAVKPGRPLAERITLPSRRSRSSSGGRGREEETAAAARKGIDRYIPMGSRRSRSRSPYSGSSRRNGGGGGGRRPGARREQQRQDGEEGGRGRGRTARPKKTQEELDAEMDSYFGGGGNGGSTGNASAAATNGGAEAAVVHPGDEDIEMIA